MVRLLAIFQTGALLFGTFVVAGTSALATDCEAVAAGIKSMESTLATAWEEKNAGGQEELARAHAQSVVDTYLGMPMGVYSCMDANGKMRFTTLISKSNLLLAVLNQSSVSIKRQNVELAKDLVRFATKYRSASPIYWGAINDDYAKVQRRYGDVVRAESDAAHAKRQAVLSITHPRESRSAASRLATMDAKTPAPRFRSSGQTSGASALQSPTCARPNVPAATIRAVEPDTPVVAQQAGISGTVQVLVSLDENSHITSTRIQSSPSAILNNAALAAAQQSTFRTEIRDCKPIAAVFVFSVDFSSQ